MCTGYYFPLHTLQHVLEGVVGDGKQVRRHFQLPLAAVLGNDAVQVDRETSVRVDSHAEQAGVGLKL